jgi:hypothetical protein
MTVMLARTALRVQHGDFAGVDRSSCPLKLSVTRKDVRRLKRMSCPATAPFDPRFLVRLERRFLVPA